MCQSINPNQNLDFDDKNEILLGMLQNPASNYKPSGLTLSICKTPVGPKLFSLCTQFHCFSTISTLSIKSLYIILCQENSLQWITENQRLLYSKIAPLRCHLLIVKRTVLAIGISLSFFWNKTFLFVQILFDLEKLQLIQLIQTTFISIFILDKQFCSKIFLSYAVWPGQFFSQPTDGPLMVQFCCEDFSLFMLENANSGKIMAHLW